ncbi:ATP-binding protein [Candidatus Leptofilum sp.]|uniref:ATP-binding protein n=1 Tax=Candidatus Leptofilum sp. TaxID=3241576 RepID=UPI003B5CC201
MDKPEKIVTFTKPPNQNPLGMTQHNSERSLRLSQILGIAALFTSLLLIGFVGFVFRRIDIGQTLPGVIWWFSFFAVTYTLFTASLILILRRTLTHVISQQTILQAMVRNYRRRTDEIQIAAQIARDASAGANLDVILAEAVQLICERFHFYHAAIFLIEETDEGASAVMRAVAGTTRGSYQMLENHHRLPVGGRSIVGHVVAAGQARVVLDVRQDAQHLFNPFIPETLSEMTVPLQVGGHILGAIDIQSREEGAFSQQDVMILQTLADLMAVTIHKANLHEAAQQHAQNLEQSVTERTRELAAERAQLNTILEAMVEGVAYYQGHDLKYINAAFTDMMGYSRSDWEGLTFMMRASHLSDTEVHQLRDVIQDAVKNTGIWRGEIKMRRKDGGEFDAHVTTVEVVTGVGDTIESGTVAIIRDISHQKALEEQKTRFVAYASHELRTPLTNLKTRLYLLKRQPHLFDKHYEVLSDVTERMQRLVDDLLEKSRFDRGMIELNRDTRSLNNLVRDVVEIQRPEAEKKALTLAAHMPPEALMAFIDADRMMQVLTNLVSNAINYTPHAGQISVTLQRKSDDYAELTVQDTGIGIPPDLVNDIFNPFVRADNVTAKGTGLGLNITKQIVDLHDGEITVSSQLNQGTTFTVCLPLAQVGTAKSAAD